MPFTETNFRRQVVRSVISLASADTFGNWELVNVTEGPVVTDLEFHLHQPVHTIDRDSVVQKISAVKITVQTTEEILE